MDASDGNANAGEASMDVSDSRKRPMDSDLDQSIAKRSNRGDCKLILLLFDMILSDFVR
jgi:hypothetical protein